MDELMLRNLSGGVMTNIKVVCNTSPIIGLMKIRQLPLLWHIFGEIMRFIGNYVQILWGIKMRLMKLGRQ